jgi:hypothetical protein
MFTGFFVNLDICHQDWAATLSLQSLERFLRMLVMDAPGLRQQDARLGFSQTGQPYKLFKLCHV